MHERFDIVNNRSRVWSPKVRTGCTTCKKRRLKCDEGKPDCQRCIRSHISCGGYASIPTTWIFHSGAAGKRSQTSSLSKVDKLADGENPTDSTGTVQHKKSDEPSREGIKPTSKSSIRSNPHGPYRQTQEQQLFKFYMEQVAALVAKSNMSISFWLHIFPQAAWQYSAIRHALLAISMAAGSTFSEARGVRSAYDFEMSRVQSSAAIRLLLTQQHSTECVLIASASFWLGSVTQGHWDTSIKHLFGAYRIIESLPNISKYDPCIVYYLRTMAFGALTYYRSTRGPCPVHNTNHLLSCESSCFEPKVLPIEVRIRDAVFHLAQAHQLIQRYRYLLEHRDSPNKSDESILQFLNTLDQTVCWLTERWTSPERFGYVFTDEYQEKDNSQDIPVTISPFTSCLNSIAEYVNNSDPEPLNLIELQQDTRVLWANFVASTGVRDSRIQEDAMLLFIGTPQRKQIEKSKPIKTIRAVR